MYAYTCVRPLAHITLVFHHKRLLCVQSLHCGVGIRKSTHVTYATAYGAGYSKRTEECKLQHMLQEKNDVCQCGGMCCSTRTQ